MRLALLYVLLALGLNIVVGYAGLLDLGYVAFYAVGAYMYALLASPHLTRTSSGSARCSRTGCTRRSGWSFRWRRGWRDCRRAAGRAHAEAARRLPGHRHAGLRRDHPRVHEQPGPPGQHHQRPQGHGPDRLHEVFGLDFGKPVELSAASRSPRSRCTTTCSWCWWWQRGDLPPAGDSRIGRAWMAIREDEIAAKAMGINTRNMKLLAFGMGATFGGVSGAMFACLPGLRLARVLQPDGVGDDRRHGGAGRHGPPARA
jgi:branched-chain amino acid transport system permease protein